MISDISDKDNKDWENFLSSDEKLPNKDLKFNKKNTSKIKTFDLHGYSLDEANNKIEDLLQAKASTLKMKIILMFRRILEF